MGSGPIGIAAMQVAKRNGEGTAYDMTDLVKERLEKAKSMGADETVLVSEDNLEQRLLDFTDGEGIPVVLTLYVFLPPRTGCTACMPCRTYRLHRTEKPAIFYHNG